MLKSIFVYLLVAFSLLKHGAYASEACTTRLNVDHSRPQGILSHGEHWIDLILAQGSSRSQDHLQAFDEIARDLLQVLESGEFQNVNEKIDGSPSVVFGWTPELTPFVAYKNHFSSQSKQKLVTDAASALSVFPRSIPLKEIFSELFQTLTPLMQNSTELQDYIFQGDLLFVAEDDRRVITESEVTIRANTMEYRVGKEDPLYQQLANARVGLAIHSVGKRTISAEGRVSVEPLPGTILENRHLLELFVEKMTHQSAFVIHPLRSNETLTTQATDRELAIARNLLFRIHDRIQRIPPSYADLAKKHIEGELRIFFNSQVRPPNDGGIFKTVASGNPVLAEDILLSFSNWLSTRKDPSTAKVLTELSSEDRDGLRLTIEAYVYAIELQYLLLPHLSPVMRSKIGGGPVEGLILTTQSAIVKFVDRLEFTLQNNQKREPFPKPTLNEKNPFSEFSYPFNEWRPNSTFVLMKAQPMHAGHVQMIKLAIESFGAVAVLASNKAPNLDSENIQSLGAATTLKKYKSRDYTHVFSNDLRNQILKSALEETLATWNQINTLDLWKYLALAKSLNLAGKIRLVVGQKEVDEGRYDFQLSQYSDHLELAPLPLQEGGISATQIRKLIKDAALGSKTARQELENHYGFIQSEWKRTQIVRGLLREWKALDKKAQELLAEKKPKGKTG